MADQDRYVIDILDVTLDLIEFLGAAESSPGASEIALHLGISRTRAFRILKTLERRGFIASDPETHTYGLGLKFLQVASQLRKRIRLRDVAEPVLLQLANETGDVALLMVRIGSKAATVNSYRGGQRVQVEVSIGVPTPLHIGAAPRILLAGLPDAERDRLIEDMDLPRYTEHTITNRDTLRRRLEEFREQGYAVGDEDYYSGEFSVGAPVRDETGQVIGAISVTAPKDRDSPERRSSLIRLVVAAANRISERMGYEGSMPAHDIQQVQQFSEAGRVRVAPPFRSRKEVTPNTRAK